MRQFLPSDHVPVDCARIKSVLERLLDDGGITRVVVARSQTYLSVVLKDPPSMTNWPFILVVLDGTMEVAYMDGRTPCRQLLRPHEAILYARETWVSVDRSATRAHLRFTLADDSTLCGIRDLRADGPTRDAPVGALEIYMCEQTMGARGHTLVQAIERTQPDRWYAQRTLHGMWLLALELLDMVSHPDTMRRGKALATWLAMRSYVHEHCCEPIGRASVAQALGLTPTHVSRLFRRFAGRGFQPYVRSLRLKRACCLLTDSRLTIKEIASTCGFDTPSYFARQFRLAEGVTPVAWRHISNGRPHSA